MPTHKRLKFEHPMKQELINQLWQRFEAASGTIEGVECWSARDLQGISGYADWRNFVNAVEKAKEACANAGEPSGNHFVGVTKMVDLGSGAKRPVDDYALTRYACYLIAQNGDPSKSEVAFAQTYFAVQTRRQELVEQRLLETDRVAARAKLRETEHKLSGLIYERGVDERSFANIRHEGDRALFGGHGTKAMKKKLGVPDSRPLADFLPTLTIKAKDFATELIPFRHTMSARDAPLFLRRTIQIDRPVAQATRRSIWRSDAEKEQVDRMKLYVELVLPATT